MREIMKVFEEIRRYCRDNDSRISELENIFEHHADMIYNKLNKKMIEANEEYEKKI